MLQTKKRALSDIVDELKVMLHWEKDGNAKLKTEHGKRNQRVVGLVENVFNRHSTAKIYYYGGKYNGNP